MLNYRIITLVGLISVFCFTSIQAATWRVEKDGSGDAMVIQHAVDAAADGDTILIGPGRYEDFELFDSGHWVEEVVVVIQKNDLTIIGSGTAETIIGRTSYYSPDGENPLLVVGINANNTRLEGLSAENCEHGVVWNSGQISINECRFFHCYYGIISFSPDGTFVENSEFIQQGGWSIDTMGDCQNVVISDSSFHGYGTSIGFNSTPNAHVTSCVFEEAYLAIGYSLGSSGEVRNCEMSNVENPIYLSENSQVSLFDNFLQSTSFSAIYLVDNSYVYGTGNVFSGGAEFGTLHFSGGSSSGLNNNHIVKGDNTYAVTVANYFYDHRVIDLENNYWGTTDIETIEEWIYDGNDDSSIHGTVDFLPLADGPVSTNNTTLDSLKALYR